VRRIRLSFGMVVLALAPSIAAAHGVLADCRLKGGQLEVEAYFDDDTPAGQVQVKVVDARKKTIADGLTDAKGLWSCPRPAAGAYEVVVNAGSGHRKTVAITVPASELPPTPMRAEPPISNEPSRAEATRFPWERLGLGLLLIAAVSTIALLVTRSRRA